MGSPCYMTIFIDGERIAQLAPGEKLTFYPNPGEYIFGSRPNDPCTGSQQEIEANVKAGKLLTYRIGYGGQADSFINRTTD